MAFLKGLQKLIGNARKQVAPIARTIGAPVNAVTNIPRALITTQGEKQGTALVNDVANRQQYSPSFRDLALRTHPVLDQNLKGDDGRNYVDDRGIFGKWNSIYLTKNKIPQATDQTVTHEALHSAWPKLNAQKQSQFLSEAQQAIGGSNAPTDLGQPVNTPQVGKTYNLINGKRYDPSLARPRSSALANYLDSKLGGDAYDGYSGVSSLNNLRSLPQNLQTEIHSYIPEYYASGGRALPPNLARYYRQYFNPSTFSPTPKTQSPGDPLAIHSFRQPNALQVLLKR